MSEVAVSGETGPSVQAASGCTSPLTRSIGGRPARRWRSLAPAATAASRSCRMSMAHMVPSRGAPRPDSPLEGPPRDSKLVPTHPRETMAARMRGEQRREQILDASLELFARRCFSATKTRDVALAAGVSEAMVFKLFPDKQALYRALIERKIAEAEAALPIAEVAGSRESPEQFFGRIASIILERIERDP